MYNETKISNTTFSFKHTHQGEPSCSSFFKEEMLCNSAEEIYDSCYKIAAVEDIYFHLSEYATLTEAQQDYILAGKHTVL